MWSTGSLVGGVGTGVLQGEHSGSEGGPGWSVGGSCRVPGTCRIYPPRILSPGCSGPSWVFQGVPLEVRDARHPPRL